MNVKGKPVESKNEVIKSNNNKWLYKIERSSYGDFNIYRKQHNWLFWRCVANNGGWTFSCATIEDAREAVNKMIERATRKEASFNKYPAGYEEIIEKTTK